MTTIVLVHAVKAAMGPIDDAFKVIWPEAKLINLLDESLGILRSKNEELSQELVQRVIEHSRYAVELGADGVLYTCSAFGEAIDKANEIFPIPILKPNEGMFRKALQMSSQIGMVASFMPAVSGMENEFYALAKEVNPDARLTSICASGAKAALNEGDTAKHNDLMAETAQQLINEEVLMLAHFSSSLALESVCKINDKPILTSPNSAVELLKILVNAKSK
ncbi:MULTISPECIES: aspartate/glutamate racemase family protein [unclassified Pseudoalteromonas]|uniref:aspartate/glutamate racemase family protein n=1 Tax=unclassified Pseudoalteromonas TaxID=194690 RepID=UPI00257359A2|nr:hypothetical protein [Pseudoalteromonas sp. MM1]BED91374.1 arylsulfatase [Pseudoalteromonas sp. MM1]